MITVSAAEKIQKELSEKVVVSEDFNLDLLKYVAGCDVEYDSQSDLITGAVVIFDFVTKEVVEVSSATIKNSFPYIPGLFSFREMPALLEAFQKISKIPDVIVCDGQGIAHPRKFGLASHIGLELNIPSVGCAKSNLFGQWKMPCEQRGCSEDIIDEADNMIIGRVLRTQPEIKPVFVSIGHKINLQASCDLVLHFSGEYRLPETTRQADHYARVELQKYLDGLKP